MSLTSTTRLRRALHKKGLGRDAKRARAIAGTPPFPLDPAQAGPDSPEKAAGGAGGSQGGAAGHQAAGEYGLAAPVLT
jgi:hypothetical protein